MDERAVEQGARVQARDSVDPLVVSGVGRSIGEHQDRMFGEGARGAQKAGTRRERLAPALMGSDATRRDDAELIRVHVEQERCRRVARDELFE